MTIITTKRKSAAAKLPPAPSADTAGGWPRRLGWMCLIWLASVAALGLAAWLMRLLMRLIGMAA